MMMNFTLKEGCEASDTAAESHGCRGGGCQGVQSQGDDHDVTKDNDRYVINDLYRDILMTIMKLMNDYDFDIENAITLS